MVLLVIFALEWLFKWVIIPLGMGFALFKFLDFVTRTNYEGSTRYVGAILHIVVISIIAIIETFQFKDKVGNGLFYPLIIFLSLSLVDCINDIRILKIIDNRAIDNDSRSNTGILSKKSMLCGLIPAIGTVVCYYISPNGPNEFVYIGSQYRLLLILSVVPRFIYTILELTALITVYPRVKKLINTGFPFKEEHISSGFYCTYFNRYIHNKMMKGIILSNEIVIYETNYVMSRGKK